MRSGLPAVGAERRPPDAGVAGFAASALVGAGRRLQSERRTRQDARAMRKATRTNESPSPMGWVVAPTDEGARADELGVFEEFHQQYASEETADVRPHRDAGRGHVVDGGHLWQAGRRAAIRSTSAGRSRPAGTAGRSRRTRARARAGRGSGTRRARPKWRPRLRPWARATRDRWRFGRRRRPGRTEGRRRGSAARPMLSSTLLPKTHRNSPLPSRCAHPPCRNMERTGVQIVDRVAIHDAVEPHAERDRRSDPGALGDFPWHQPEVAHGLGQPNGVESRALARSSHTRPRATSSKYRHDGKAQRRVVVADRNHVA